MQVVALAGPRSDAVETPRTRWPPAVVGHDRADRGRPAADARDDAERRAPAPASDLALAALGRAPA